MDDELLPLLWVRVTGRSQDGGLAPQRLRQISILFLDMVGSTSLSQR